LEIWFQWCELSVIPVSPSYRFFASLTKSKKQTVTADSSTIAELIAAFLASKEIAWARSMLTELGYQQDHPTILHEDNQSTIQMINNDSNTKNETY
jgi:hypothetical protein